MNIAKHIKGINVMVVAVNDLDKAIDTYKKFGFEFIGRTPREVWGLEAGEFKVGETAKIELLTPVSQDKPVAKILRKFLKTRGEGLYEIGIQVDDIEAVYRHIKESGAKIVAPPHVPPSNPSVKLMWLSPKSTHGVFLEFIVR